jgi:GNAT superfamily N-acetyltransferase
LSSVVSEVERAAAATWPASTIEYAQGWLLRHCALLRRKRSNSALPPAEIDDPVAAIEQVERFYTARDATPIVQVSPLHRHEQLDAFLAERGYSVVAPTSAMVGDPEQLATLEPAEVFDVRLDTEPHTSWLAACEAVGSKPEPSLDRIRQPVGFAVAVRDETPVGVGLFVVAGQWCGIYCMATHPRWRRRGVAGSILGAGARWALEGGARKLFLQVEADNPGARRVYEHAGFRLLHSYHYRVR